MSPSGLRPGEVTDDVDDGAVGGPSMLPGAIASNHELRVLAAFPVDRELDLLSSPGQDLDDDLLDQQPHDTLARADIGGRVIPDPREVLGEAKDYGAVGCDLALRLRGQGGQALFQFVHLRKDRIPAPFQRRCHEAVLRLDGVVLPPRALRLVSGLTELQLDRVADSRSLLGAGVGEPTGSVDRTRREHTQDFPTDGLIDAESPEGDTAVGAVIDRGAPAAVPRDIAADA